MATAPARPRALAKVRLWRPGPAATTAILLTLLTAASAFARTRELSAAYWIDEGLSWGISSHHFFSIPHVLRQDGSPPLYYLMLHIWMKLFGTSEEATHVLSLIPAIATVPLGYWAGRSLFGQRAVRVQHVPHDVRAGDAHVLVDGAVLADRQRLLHPRVRVPAEALSDRLRRGDRAHALHA